MDSTEAFISNYNTKKGFRKKLSEVLGMPKVKPSSPIPFNNMLEWVEKQNIIIGFSNDGITISKNRVTHTSGQFTLTELLYFIAHYLYTEMETVSDMFNEVVIEDIIEKIQELSDEHLSGRTL